jgi:hypothetical protein
VIDDVGTALAKELIIATRAALKRGVRHYTKDGTLLRTDLEIIRELAKSGTIILEDPK